MKWEVEHCGDCGFFQSIDDHRGAGKICDHPELKDWMPLKEGSGTVPPGWCPLRKSAVYFKLIDGPSET